MSAEQPSKVSSKVKEYMHIVFVCDVTDPLTGQRHDIYKQTKSLRARSANNATRGGNSSEDSIEECRQSLQESLSASNFVDEATISEIMKCTMDGHHTVEEFVKQALDGSIVEFSICTRTEDEANVKTDDTVQENTVKLVLTPQQVEAPSCVCAIIPDHQLDGEFTGKCFLQPLQEPSNAFVVNLPSHSSKTGKLLLEQDLEIAFEKSGRLDEIPQANKDKMDANDTKTLLNNFCIATDEQFQALCVDSSAFWIVQDESKCWSSEMAKKSSPTQKACDKIPVLKMPVQEIRSKYPRAITWEEEEELLGCLKFAGTKVTHAAGTGSSTVQQIQQGMVMQPSALPTTAQINTAGISTKRFIAPNLGIVFRVKLVSDEFTIKSNLIPHDKECCVCLDRMDDSEDSKDSKVQLKCAHVICCKCCDDLFAEAAKIKQEYIGCPQCRQPTMLKDTARYGTADRQALIQRTLEKKWAARQLSVEYFWWCAQPSTKSQVFFQIKCEAIQQMIALVLQSQSDRDESLNLLYRVEMSSKKWLQQYQEKQSKEAQYMNDQLKYMQDVTAHVQAIVCDLKRNVENLNDLQNWRTANIDIQKIPPGYERFCVSLEDVERFGVILRAKFPAHFGGASKRAHADMSLE